MSNTMQLSSLCFTKTLIIRIEFKKKKNQRKTVNRNEVNKLRSNHTNKKIICHLIMAFTYCNNKCECLALKTKKMLKNTLSE